MSAKISTKWLEQYELIKKKIGEQLGSEPSQYEVASFLGIRRGKVAAWAGGQRPSADDLEIIARTLNLSPKWLLLFEGDSVEISTEKDALQQAATIDPIVQRMVEAERLLRAANAPDGMIQQVICDLVRGAGEAAQKDAGQEPGPEFPKAGNGR